MELDFRISDCPFEQYFTTNFVSSEVLTISEKELAKTFSAKRLQHFSTGRYCAKMAFKNLTQDSVEILKGIDGEPIWPAGFIGSISHSNALIGAIAASKREFQSIGLDIETIGRMKREMWGNIFTPNEQCFLNELSINEIHLHTTLLFSMKESFYKLQYPLTGVKLWFRDVEIVKSVNSYSLKIIKDFPEKVNLPATIDMHYTVYNNEVISYCYL